MSCIRGIRGPVVAREASTGGGSVLVLLDARVELVELLIVVDRTSLGGLCGHGLAAEGVIVAGGFGVDSDVRVGVVAARIVGRLGVGPHGVEGAANEVVGVASGGSGCVGGGVQVAWGGVGGDVLVVMSGRVGGCGVGVVLLVAAEGFLG